MRSPRRNHPLSLGLVSMLTVFALWTSAAHAKPKRTRAATGKAARTESARNTRATSDGRGAAAPGRLAPSTADAARPVPDTPTSRPKSDDNNGDITAEGATTSEKGGAKPSKTRVYTFGAMDVEGKLKTPQLLYFLNRVKLELEMSAPDRRSFMKELEKSADDPHL